MNTQTTKLPRNLASDMTSLILSKRRFSPITAACAFVCGTLAGFAHAQTPPSSFQPAMPGVMNAQQTTPSSVLRGAIGGVDFSVNANVAKLTVEVEKDDLPADGQSTNDITIRLFDKNGAPLKGEALITVEHSAGRILVPGASTDELGPSRRDVDKITPPDLSREMAAGIKGAKLTLFKDCGHFSSMERPELVTAALRELLAG